MKNGFSLIQLCVMLTVGSLLVVISLPISSSVTRNSSQTATRMNAVLSALRKYEAANGSLPCPADATLPIGETLYGVPAANGGITGDCTGGSPSANFSDSANHVAIGMVPVRALGLSPDFAQDSYGRDITYAVDTHATSCFTGTLGGSLSVGTDGGSAVDNAVAVLVSHGTSGHGAFLPMIGTAGTATRLNAGVTDSNQLTNAHLDAGFNPTTVLTNFIQSISGTMLDNIVVYQNALWNLNTPPQSVNALLPAVAGPASGTYIAGQTLSFTLTYNGKVTVTGSPRLTLTIGSNTRYATYAGGSGTAILTFSYLLGPADYAPTGISLAPMVDLNGGSISPYCTVFTAPLLTYVLVKKLMIYVSDWYNNRVEKFDAYGAYQSKFGTYGILGGLLSHPGQMAVDGSGNIFVSDWGNSRVEKFNASGSFVSQFGSLGIFNGQFVNPGSIVIDGSGNLWVDDINNNRVEEFSASGGYMSKFGGLGVFNGQFLGTSGLAMDADGNFWVGDWTTSRLQKMSPSGSYLGQFGSLGWGNGQFVGPCGHAIDSSGNLWVVDSGNNRVEEFSAAGSNLGKFGSIGSGNGQFSTPCGIAIDVAGNLWVGDGANNRVQEFNAAGSYLAQFGSFGSGNGQFWQPAGLALTYQ